jgi:DNA-binding MarR family transcriptional regulator
MNEFDNSDICFHFRRAARLISVEFEKYFDKCHIRSTQFSLLMAINNNPNCCVTNIASVMGMDRTTVARNVVPLLKDGYLRIAPAPTKREKYYAISDLGRQTLENTKECYARACARINSLINNDKSKDLLTSVRSLADSLANLDC